jgi:hypothetical protein
MIYTCGYCGTMYRKEENCLACEKKCEKHSRKKIAIK